MYLSIKSIYLIYVISYVFCDITSPVNYQPIKYSQVFLEIHYGNSLNAHISKIDLTSQNSLITSINSKKDIIVSGRLLVAQSKGSSRHPNDTQFLKTDPSSGCSRIMSVSEVRWIAVILKGGSCSIRQKLLNAKQTNASAVIIIENPSRNSEKYDLDTQIGLQVNDLGIPEKILLNESVFINATITINNFVVDGFISRTSVLFVSISFILLMIISLVWLTFYYIQRFRYMHAKERLSRRLANAAKKALSKIPTKVLSADDKEVSYDYDQCAICIDNYQVGETIRILPCKHIFHKICIDSWLIEQRSCPMCKVDILKACGILSVTSNKMSNNRPNALLEAGLISSDPETGDSSTFDAVESNLNPASRCPRGHSSFLQRYRDRYGLHHYYPGHIKNHCHKFDHYHRKYIRHCSYHRDKVNQSVEIDVEVSSMLNKNPVANIDTEKVDLISESENSIASFNQTSIHLPNSKDDNKMIQRLTTNYEDLHEISHGLICDICDSNSENPPTDCDICGPLPNQSPLTSCSSESCDCYVLERQCRHYNENMNNSTRFGNLLGCCVSSDSDGNRQTSRNNHDRQSSNLCCYNPCSECQTRYLRNPHIGNPIEKSHKPYKHCSSKSRCHVVTKDSHNPMATHLTDNLINVNQFATATCTKPYLPNVGTRKNVYDNMKQLKSIQLTKNLNKCATIDSYTKSSLSDDYDYEADGGSSSLEINIPVVKLTVLPPQVQYHQGSPNSDTSHSSSKTAEMNVAGNAPNSDEYQESDNSKSNSIIQDYPDHS